MPEAATGAIASTLQLADARPHVLADPTQVEGGRVWATVHDVMPGASLPHGHAVVAWGDLVWIAEVEWDPDDIQVLWLHPVDGPRPTPNVRQTYQTRRIAEQIVAAMEPVLRVGHPEPVESSVQAVSAVIAPVLDDFDQTVAHHLHFSRSTRISIVAALKDLEGRGPTKAIRRFLNSVPGSDLIRMARYYRYPTP